LGEAQRGVGEALTAEKDSKRSSFSLYSGSTETNGSSYFGA